MRDVETDAKGSPTADAHQSTSHPLLKRCYICFKSDHHLQRSPPFGEEMLQSLGLAERAWKAVKNELSIFTG